MNGIWEEASFHQLGDYTPLSNPLLFPAPPAEGSEPASAVLARIPLGHTPARGVGFGFESTSFCLCALRQSSLLQAFPVGEAETQKLKNRKPFLLPADCLSASRTPEKFSEFVSFGCHHDLLEFSAFSGGRDWGTRPAAQSYGPVTAAAGANGRNAGRSFRSPGRLGW